MRSCFHLVRERLSCRRACVVAVVAVFAVVAVVVIDPSIGEALGRNTKPNNDNYDKDRLLS